MSLRYEFVIISFENQLKVNADNAWNEIAINFALCSSSSTTIYYRHL